MTGLVRAELRKYFTTRMAWGMPLAMFLTGVLFAAITAGFLIFGSFQVGDGDIDLRTALPELTLARMVYTGGVQIGYLLTLVLGVLSMGQEFRHKTATSTFLAGPRRTQVILAKVAALVVVATLNGLAHLVGALVGGGVMLGFNDLPVLPEPASLLPTFGLLLLVLALWGLLGLGLGVLVPNQIAALFLAVALAWIVEPLLGWGLGFLDGGAQVAQFFPSQATLATLSVFEGADAGVAQAMGSSPDQLAWWAGALTLLAYAAVAAGVGAWLTRRRDIA